MAYNVPINQCPTFLFTPYSAQTNLIRLQNIGNTPVWVGTLAQVSTPVALGLQVPPGKVLNLTLPPTTTATLYATAGYVSGAVGATASASALTAGSSSLSTTTTVPTALAAGTVFLLGKGNASEVLTVASTAANSTVTFTNPSLYDHVASSLLTLATATVGQLLVNTGTF